MWRRVATAALSLGTGAGAVAVAGTEDPAATLKVCAHLPPRLLRSANRLQELCFGNSGIYIKLGQHIAQLYVVPEEYVQTMRESMLKKWPVSSYEDARCGCGCGRRREPRSPGAVDLELDGDADLELGAPTPPRAAPAPPPPPPAAVLRDTSCGGAGCGAQSRM